MNRQDWYLNKLGIYQYVLRKPNVIQGEAKVEITNNIKLIVISEHYPKEKIFQDILKAIHVTIDDCLILKPAQLLITADKIFTVIWFLDQPIPENWSEQDISSKPIIMTNSLAELASSPQQKRQLWQTLCQYENYFRSY